jgi:hypothetical protein
MFREEHVHLPLRVQQNLQQCICVTIERKLKIGEISRIITKNQFIGTLNRFERIDLGEWKE